MNSSTTNNDHDGFTYGVAFVVGSVVLLLTVAFACVRLRLHIARGPNILNSLAGTPPSPPTRDEDSVEQGLGLRLHHIDTSFESYPKLLYSQKEKGSSSSNICSSSCSICLGDYKEGDMLRLLPHCLHIFHLACVDPWLRLHSTCPICRKSSLQPPSN
ncbi:hypothetical protein VNO80_15806 [Phaseolus coccineus]|uniref:RING-type domain-containing protein n=1 Tax=Phaseolus coccineus TaxID=3886 RepID=A0AAN9MQJ7_PHACN